MPMRRQTVILFAVLTALLYSHMCFSQLYFGAASGATDYADLAQDVSSNEYSVGLQAHENFAVEASWLDLGDTRTQRQNGYTTNFNVEGFKIGAKGIIPLSHMLSIYATTGVYFWDIDSQHITSQTLIQSNGAEQDADIFIGGGLEWRLTDELSVNLNYQEIQIVGDNIGNLSTGLTISF